MKRGCSGVVEMRLRCAMLHTWPTVLLANPSLCPHKFTEISAPIACIKSVSTDICILKEFSSHSSKWPQL